MSKTFIDSLYEAYNALLKDREAINANLSKVADMITSSGGIVPNETKKTLDSITIEYPFGGTWKEKILYVLKHDVKPFTPATAKEIAEHILIKHELRADRIKVLSMVTQYTSSMGIEGVLDKTESETGYRNLYSLPNKD